MFEFLNSVNMTSGSWAAISKYALRPYVFLFFALSPILVWGFNKEIYEFVGNRFWFMGIVMGFVEFASYLVAGILFYRKSPSLRELIAFSLMLIALFIAGEKEPQV